MARKYSSISVETTLASGISNSATSMTVASGTGSALMGGVTLNTGDQFTVAIDPDTNNEEIVFVTVVASDTLTITRARAGTTAVTHAAGATVKHVLTGDDLTWFEANTSPVDSWGLSGSSSGTTTLQASAIASGTITFPAVTDTVAVTNATQTFTNKTISADSNTLSGIAASSFVVSNASGNIDGSAAQKAIPTGDVVGTSDTQTLTNKTLTTPTINDARQNVTLNAQTGTTYTLVLTDNGRLITLNNAAAITVTVPLNSSVAFATGAIVNLQQIGAGQVTVVGASGVTVNATGTKTRAQWSAASLVKTGTDTWTLIGDLTA